MSTDRLDRYVALAALPMTVVGTAQADVIASGASSGVTDLSVSPDGTSFASSVLFSYDDILFLGRAAQFYDYLGSGLVLASQYLGTDKGSPVYTTAGFSRGAAFWSSTLGTIISGSLVQGTGIDRTWIIDLGGDLTLTFDFNYDLAFTIRTSTDDEGPFGTVFILNSWSYTVEDGASTPVPGLGGLAMLACGAAGLRRKRQRVA